MKAIKNICAERERLLDVEMQIKALCNWSIPILNDWEWSKFPELESLFAKRQNILNGMFKGSDEEIRRFNIVNCIFRKLTALLSSQLNLECKNIKCNLAMSVFDDFEVQGILAIGDFSKDCVLKLSDDEFYGSDFYYMIKLMTILSRFRQDYVRKFTLNTDNFDKCITDDLDGVFNNWADCALNNEKLKTIKFCYALHVLCAHQYFAIVDCIRLNEFLVETKIDCQNFL